MISLNGNVAGRIKTLGSDNEGGFAGLRYGVNGMRTLYFFIAYQVCQKKESKAGVFTAYQHQYFLMRAHGIQYPKPRHQVLDNPLQLVQEFRKEGFWKMIFMDTNGDWNHPTHLDTKLKLFIERASLVVIYYEQFTYLPRTFLWNQNSLNFFFIDRGL